MMISKIKQAGGRKAAFFVAALCIASALAACKREAALTYKDAAIDPMCFMQGAEPAGINLDACTGSAGADEYTVPEKGIETFADGSTGYTFQCEGGCMRPPFVAYKTVGTVADGHVVRVESSGGGTGVFSDVRVVRVTGDMLEQKIIAGGDRCNGGITEASAKGGVVRYGQNITPFDLVELAKGNGAGFEAYDDISACAACCIGVAEYEGEALTGVTLTADAVEDVAGQGYSGVDTCFYGVYNDVTRAGKKHLSVQELVTFGEEFHARCADLKTRNTAHR